MQYYKEQVQRSWSLRKCYFTYHGTDDLHYANTPLLSLFLSQYGNILPRAQTFLTAKMQRKLARTIKTSRQAGLLPYKGNWFGLRSVAKHLTQRLASLVIATLTCCTVLCCLCIAERDTTLLRLGVRCAKRMEWSTSLPARAARVVQRLRLSIL